MQIGFLIPRTSIDYVFTDSNIEAKISALDTTFVVA